MGFKINLSAGTENNKMSKGVKYDPVEEGMGYAAAVSNMEQLTVSAAVLTAGAENLERAIVLSKAISTQTGDNAVAVAAGTESLTATLRTFGQDAMVADMQLEGKDLTGAMEGISDVLESMYKKSKEVANNIWVYIQEMADRALKFVLGIFGADGDSGVSIKALLEKAKKSEQTNLTATEFDESTATRLAKSVAALLTVNPTDITGDRINNFINAQESVVTAGVNGGKLELAVALEQAGRDVVTAATEIATADVDEAAFVKMFTDKVVIDGYLTGGISDIPTKTGFVNGSTGDAGDVVTTNQGEIEKELGDFEAAVVTCTGLTPSKLYFTAIMFTEEGLKAYKRITASKQDVNGEAYKIATLKADINAAISGFKIIAINLTGDAVEAVKNAKNVVPVSYDDAATISDTYTKVNKKLEGNVDKIQKTIKKSMNAYNKTEKAVFTEIEKALTDKDAEVVKFLTKLASGTLKNILAVAKANAVGTTATSVDLVKSKFVDIVKASVKLYEKK